MLNSIIAVMNALVGPMTLKGPRGFYVEGPAFLVMGVLLGLLVLFVGSLAWVWNDASNRGKNSLIAVIFILVVGWPISFIWWLWLRPQLSEEAKARLAGYYVPVKS